MQPAALAGAFSTRTLFVSAVLLCGCAGGHVWVEEAAHADPSSARRPKADLPTEPVIAAETQSGGSGREARWRVITLGQRVEVPADSSGEGEPSPRSDSPPTVVVNNYYSPAYGYGYGYAASGLWLGAGAGSGRRDHGHGPHPEPLDSSYAESWWRLVSAARPRPAHDDAHGTCRPLALIS